MNDDDCMAGMAGHGQFLRFISFLMRHRDDPHMCAVGAMARGGALASLVHFPHPSARTMSNINGGMGRGGRSALSSVDFYRRVPKDLTEVR